jgi:uncharacterized protein (TIGR00661 family)
VKILYTIAGEGMGHATRSRVVVDFLRRKGHRVLCATSARAVAFLRRAGFDVVELGGLRLAYVDGAMDLGESIRKNLGDAPAMLARNVPAWQACQRFDPDAVVTDFEPFGALFARAHGLPAYSVDNHQAIARCAHARDVVGDDAGEMAAMRAFVHAVAPGCRAYVATSFYFPPPEPACARDTVLVPPILRDGVLRARPSDGEHVLVYQTSTSDTRLLDALRSVPSQRFVVYGLRQNAQVDNCTLRDFSEEGFLRDLASARGVVTNGGMSLLGEAVALGKPVYSVPVRGQFEQVLNARYLAKLGYGCTSATIEPGVLAEFLHDLPGYASTLRAAPRHDANQALYQALDRIFG